MTAELRVFSILVGLLVFVGIIELVRQRKLREEYSWLWLLAGASILVLSSSYDFAIVVGRFFGGVLPSTILYLFAIIFLVLISLHFSVKISKLHDQVKNLAQEIALLKETIKEGDAQNK
jgi:uncharacterized membrane protein